MQSFNHYQQLLDDFFSDICCAINNYKKKYKHKIVPSHRREDISKIMTLLDYELNIETLLQDINSILSEFKTGWWIFETGHSRLRDEINRVINNPKYKLVEFKQAIIEDLEYELQNQGKLKLDENYKNMSKKELANAYLAAKRYIVRLERKTFTIEQSPSNYFSHSSDDIYLLETPSQDDDLEGLIADYDSSSSAYISAGSSFKRSSYGLYS